MLCPECGSSNLYKRGHREGRQKYQCKNCGRFFIEGTRWDSSYSTKNSYKVMPIETERKILMYRLNIGLPIEEVAKHFNCSQDTVRLLEKRYKKNLVRNK